MFKLILLFSFMLNFTIYSMDDEYVNVADNYDIKVLDPEIVEERKEIEIDYENLLPVIQKHLPVFYLHSKEKYLPILAEEYFTNPETAIVSNYFKDPETGKYTIDTNCCYNISTPFANKFFPRKKRVIVPAGQVTMEKIYSIYESYSEGDRDKLYFDIPKDIEIGSNPPHKDNEGNLNSPVYVYTFEKDNNIYIQYMFLYGFNGPYPICCLRGDDCDFQDGHECDLEHITIEIDKNSKEIKRLYYGAHGTGEGTWIDANNPDIEYEGTSPVFHMAKGAHGLYNKAGTLVRIYGFANDHMNKGKRWKPILKRVFDNKDARFDKKTMGWMYFPGNYGQRGVASICRKDWFGNPANDGGWTYDQLKKLFVPEAKNRKQKFINFFKILALMPKAKIPGGQIL